MDKNRIFQHYSKILDDMLENSLFFETYFQMPSSIYDIEGSIDDPAFTEGLFLRFGISRGCIIDDNFDYVVKFDIDTDNNGGSMCEREVEFYHEAVQNGLNKYFTSAAYIGTYTKQIMFYDAWTIERYINWDCYDPEMFDDMFMKEEDNFGDIIPITISVPLYAYPRAKNYKYSMLIGQEEARCKTLARQINSPLRRKNLQLAMEFVHRYGMDEYVKFSNFLEQTGINDLHYKNIGSLGGQLVLIDYSGYHSGDSSAEDSEWEYSSY